MQIHQCRIHHTNVLLKTGDITKEEVDVIVNAANSALLGGGGVDGAIHQAGGPKILADCKIIREKQRQEGKPIGCMPGEAFLTCAGNLKAKHVIHTVGPDMRLKVNNGDQLLSNAYRNSLRIASQIKARSIAFPSISTGIYQFPIEKAAKIFYLTLKNELQNPTSIDEIRMVLFSEEDFKVYKKVLELLSSTS